MFLILPKSGYLFFLLSFVLLVLFEIALPSPSHRDVLLCFILRVFFFSFILTPTLRVHFCARRDEGGPALFFGISGSTCPSTIHAFAIWPICTLKRRFELGGVDSRGWGELSVSWPCSLRCCMARLRAEPRPFDRGGRAVTGIDSVTCLPSHLPTYWQGRTTSEIVIKREHFVSLMLWLCSSASAFLICLSVVGEFG